VRQPTEAAARDQKLVAYLKTVPSLRYDDSINVVYLGYNMKADSPVAFDDYDDDMEEWKGVVRGCYA
jgi:hypothetical protein